MKDDNILFTSEEKLTACEYARGAAAEALYVSLKAVLFSDQPFSEFDLCQKWQQELSKNEQVLPDGWYAPPPYGFAALFGQEGELGKLNYDSLRPERNWPSKNNYLNRDSGLAYVYASPVDKNTGIIGDFGMTVYLGKDPEIQKHLKRCLDMNNQIFDQIEVGMKFSEIAKVAGDLFIREGLSNNVTSITDPAGVNIGHTVPASYEDWIDEEMEILASGDPGKIVVLIKEKRKFVSTTEPFEIPENVAFTLEPRLTQPGNHKIPMASYHTIVMIKNGRKQLLANFEEIFQLVGMDYMGNY